MYLKLFDGLLYLFDPKGYFTLERSFQLKDDRIEQIDKVRLLFKTSSLFNLQFLEGIHTECVDLLKIK